MHRAPPKSTKKLTKIIHDFRNVDWHKVRLDLMKVPILQAIQGTENIDCALGSVGEHDYGCSAASCPNTRNSNEVSKEDVDDI